MPGNHAHRFGVGWVLALSHSIFETKTARLLPTGSVPSIEPRNFGGGNRIRMVVEASNIEAVGLRLQADPAFKRSISPAGAQARATFLRPAAA